MTDSSTTIPTPARRRRARHALLAATAAALVAAALAGPRLFASDHQDTPEVELNPRLDINDVWLFPGASDSRVVLAMTVASPLTPAQTASARFDPNALYQLKIDNTGDAVEDLVIQFVFDDSTNAAGQVVGAQKVSVIGPVAPRDRGARNRLASANATLTGAMGTAFGSATGMQVFAGATDDPFYIDLEQFFRLVPDRRPSRGALSLIGPGTATGFRPACVNGQPPANPAPFDGRRGCAVDFLRGLNALAIVIELPESMVRGSGAEGRIGLWATVSN
jgi:hypothetical protein